MTTLPSFPQNIQTQGINWKAAIFWGIMLGLGAFVIYYYREPITSLIMNFQVDPSCLTLDNALAFVQKYGILISGGAAAISLVYGLYKSSQTNKALQELTSTKQTASSEVNDAYKMADQYRTQAESYQQKYEQVVKNNSTDALLEAQTLLQKERDTNKSLTGQVQALSDKANMGETEMISALQKKGYTIEKKTVYK